MQPQFPFWLTEMRKTIRLIICSLFLVFCISPSIEASTSFITEYKYQSSDFDTRLSSRVMAIENIRRVLLGEMAAHFEVEPEIKILNLTTDNISVLTLLVFRPEILNERYISGEYSIKAKVIAENRQFLKYYEALRQEPQKMQEFEEFKKRSKELFSEAEDRKKELDIAPIKDRGKNGPYMQVIRKLDTIDDFIRGYTNALFGKHREAINAFTRVVDLDQNNWNAYYNRGLSYLQLNESNLALVDFEKAMDLAHADLELDARSISNYKNIESIVKEKVNPKQIIAIMDQAIKANPNDADAFYNRGTAYLILENFDKAITDFNRAIELKPQNFDYYHNRKVAIQHLTAKDQWIALPPSAEEIQRRRMNEMEMAAEREAKEREERIAEQRQREIEQQELLRKRLKIEQERLETEKKRLELERNRPILIPPYYGGDKPPLPIPRPHGGGRP